MATNDRDDVTKKITDKMAQRARREHDIPGTVVDGMSDAARTDLERKFGGRVTGGAGYGPARK